MRCDDDLHRTNFFLFSPCLSLQQDTTNHFSIRMSKELASGRTHKLAPETIDELKDIGFYYQRHQYTLRSCIKVGDAVLLDQDETIARPLKREEFEKHKHKLFRVINVAKHVICDTEVERYTLGTSDYFFELIPGHFFARQIIKVPESWSWVTCYCGCGRKNSFAYL